jgi:hypothetical protein
MISNDIVASTENTGPFSVTDLIKKNKTIVISSDQKCELSQGYLNEYEVVGCFYLGNKINDRI